MQNIDSMSYQERSNKNRVDVPTSKKPNSFRGGYPPRNSKQDMSPAPQKRLGSEAKLHMSPMPGHSNKKASIQQYRQGSIDSQGQLLALPNPFENNNQMPNHSRKVSLMKGSAS